MYCDQYAIKIEFHFVVMLVVKRVSSPSPTHGGEKGRTELLGTYKMVTMVRLITTPKKSRRVCFESFHECFGNEPFQTCHYRVVFIAITICRCCFEIFEINIMDILMLIISYSLLIH